MKCESERIFTATHGKADGMNFEEYAGEEQYINQCWRVCH